MQNVNGSVMRHPLDHPPDRPPADAEEAPLRVDDEFPFDVNAAAAAFDRRTFLKVMGAALAAGVGACTTSQPLEKIVPYVKSPEHVVPGVPLFYATALPLGIAGAGGGYLTGYGRGVIVEQHEGRPTKVEGNPAHPSTLGGTDLFMQASVLSVYDPDRSKSPLRGGQPATWGAVLDDLRASVTRAGGADRLRIRLLTGTLTGPTIASQLRQLKAVFPQLVWHVDDLPGNASAREGQRRALGRAVTPVVDLTRARRIVSLDAHFLADEPGAVRYAREFAYGRRLRFKGPGPNATHRAAAAGDVGPLTPDAMSRLYMAESTVTFTGAMADHRLPVRPGRVAALAAALARAVLGGGGLTTGGLSPEEAAWIAAAAADLRDHRGAGLVLVGEYQPPEVHAIAHALNASLGNVAAAGGAGALTYVEPVEVMPDALGQPARGTLAELARALRQDGVDLLIVLGVNPLSTAPGDVDLAEGLDRLARGGRMSLHVGAMADETAARCTHHVPLAHPLEAWGDVRGHDGTASIIQPLIQPLWNSKSAVEVLGALVATGLAAGRSDGQAPPPDDASPGDLYAEGYDLVRRHWLRAWADLPPGERELSWRRSLRTGVIEGTAAARAEVPAPAAERLLADLDRIVRPAPADSIDLVFRPDPTLAEGSWANHPWLQELPKPLTHLTWESVALVGPETARGLGLHGADLESRKPLPVVRISAGEAGRTVDLPACVVPGHPEGTVTLPLGGGQHGGGVAQGVGENVAPLRPADRWWRTRGAGNERLTVAPTGATRDVACTQPTQTMHGRDVARTHPVSALASADARNDTPDLYATAATSPGAAGRRVHLSLYDENRYTGYKWGMVIDLSACIGCAACVVACQAENNIPTVGKDQVRRGREMHWLRIDTYFGPPAATSVNDFGRDPSPDVHFQPMLCQHCENAPCEVVCPVEATSHSAEGLNEMTYNRCVGTRYCSNNCPYKVRRFNFLQYSPAAPAANARGADGDTSILQKNPNVTVRSRGVMEKCTYCVQRISRARIDAKRAWAQSASDPTAPAPPMRAAVADGWLPGGTADPLPRLAVQTACQQACPTEAIIFGDLNDADALVSRLKADAPFTRLNYGVLTELNTQPRTSYLARLRNPHPGLAAGGAEGGAR